MADCLRESNDRVAAMYLPLAALQPMAHILWPARGASPRCGACKPLLATWTTSATFNRPWRDEYVLRQASPIPSLRPYHQAHRTRREVVDMQKFTRCMFAALLLSATAALAASDDKGWKLPNLNPFTTAQPPT